MKSALFVAVAASAALLSLHAGEAEDRLKAAVAKLTDAPGYTWVSTTDISGAPMRLSPTTGKVEKGGFMVLSTEAFGSEIEVVRKGTNAVVKTDDGWMTAAELPQPNFGGGGVPNMGAMMGRRLLSSKPPGEEVDSLLRRLGPLKADGDVLSGEFTEEGAKEYLKESRRGRSFAEPKSAKGGIRFWLKDGIVAKSELNLDTEMETPQGSMSLNSKTTTEIKDVGTTKVRVAPEALKKLGL